MKLPRTLTLDGHRVFQLYHQLRLQLNGQPMESPTPVEYLNDLTNQRRTARAWLEIIEPAYNKMTGIPPLAPSRNKR